MNTLPWLFKKAIIPTNFSLNPRYLNCLLENKIRVEKVKTKKFISQERIVETSMRVFQRDN